MTTDRRRIGIDIGGTKMSAVAIDLDDPSTTVASTRVDTPSDPDMVLERVAGCVATLGGAASVGIGLPGLVDRSGVLRSAPNLPTMVGIDVVGPLASRLGLHVVVDNDAACALRAELAVGAARGESSVALITLGTGIGGAIAIDGVVWRGANGFAGEPGHMCVDPDGPICVCGRRGCWERYASGAGIERTGRAAGLSLPDRRASEAVVAAARAGDPRASAVMGGFAEWLGIGIADMVDLLDPALVVIGGGLVEAADLYLEPARRSFDAHVLGGAEVRGTRIVTTALGPDSGAVGAALLN